MKYNIKYYTLLFALVLSFASCDLDRFPEDKVSTPTFWKSENDVRLALMGCYSYVPTSVYDAYEDGNADNAYCQYPWESNATSISSGSINNDLSDDYGFQGIRRFNYFLDNVDKSPISDQLKARYKAEVRVLRAWRYFDLANKFGAIPLITKSISEAAEAAIAPTAEGDVIKFVIKELDESIPSLPEKPEYRSMLCQDAAWVIKSRVHLFYGQWKEAAEASQKVMNSKNGYKLFKVSNLTADDLKDDYSNLIDFASEQDKKNFMLGLRSYEKMFWDANQGNSELIFEVEYIKESQWDYSSGINTLFFADNAGGGWSSITPTQELVNSYWKRDGSKFNAPTKEERAKNYNKGDFSQAYLSEFKNRDTRLYASIMFPGSVWNAMSKDFIFKWNKGGNNISKTGYNFRKMTDPNTPREEYKAPQNFMAMRYAEVLLNYAEAQNELSGPSASVFDALDQIRERVSMPKIDRAANATKEALRNTIRNERRIELAAEGFRWDDIRRWKLSKDVMKNIYAVDGDLAQERRWEDKFYRLPYPQEAVDRNPNLKDAQTAKGY